MPSSCAASGSVTMPWQPVAPISHASSPSSYPPSSTWSPHVLSCSASLHRMRGVGVHASDSQSHLHGHHILDSAAEMWRRLPARRCRMALGTIGAEAGLSVKTESGMVRLPINVLPTSHQHFPVIVFFLLASISSTRQMRHSSQKGTYISLACNASSRSLTASRGILSLSTTPSRSKNHPRVQPSPCVHPAHSTLLRCPKPSQLRTVRAILNAG